MLSSGQVVALLLGGTALREPALQAAARIAAKTGARLHAETFATRWERGAGLPVVERIAYLAELAGVQLREIDHLILVDAKAPVSFFGYPGKESYLAPEGCTVHTLSTPEQDATASLHALCRELDAEHSPPALAKAERPGRPRGKKLTAESVCKAIGHLLPANAIIVDEAVTSGLMLSRFTAGAPRHDVITLTGGAIGWAGPAALGAAIACPDRPVLALIGDGSAMYTIQSLWSMARERLNVTTLIFNNAAYAVLNVELERVGAQAQAVGDRARSQLDLTNPVIHFAELGRSMGVHSVRVDTTEALVAALERALATPGPHLIEAMVPPALAGLKLKLLPRILGSLEGTPQPAARFFRRKIAP